MRQRELTDLQWQQVREQFGAAVREIREFHGDTQDEFADALGVRQSTVSGWEKGRSFPRGRTLYKLCKWIGVSLDFLFGCSRERHTDLSRARAKLRVG